MSFFEGYLFYLYLIVALIPAIILGIMEKPLRYYTLGVSLVFIALIFKEDKIQLISLILFYLVEWALIKGYLYIRKKYGRKENLYYLALFLSALPLVVAKVSPLFHISIFGFLGISYLTFKSLQMIIETYDGVIKEVKFLEYSGFMLLFTTLSSGPIDRSRRFHENWAKIPSRSDYLELLGNGIFKLLLGIVYKVIIAIAFFKLMQFFDVKDIWYCTIAYGYSYGFYLFFDFAGYSLMAIGASYILGIATPDNFKAPFIAKDMKDFWNRWHITLSYWLRDFFFSRFIMKCVKKKWFKNRLQRASIGFITNMLIMGAWHGLTVSYLLYGLYHGCLLALTEIYEKKSKFYKKNKDKKSYKLVSWFITLQLVMFGFLIFSGRFAALYL